jgi:hypothetical protein
LRQRPQEFVNLTSIPWHIIEGLVLFSTWLTLIKAVTANLRLRYLKPSAEIN